MLRIHARIRQPQPRHRPPADQVFLHNLLCIPRFHKSVPDGLGIHDHHRPVLTLIQAAGLIHPHSVLQSSRLHGIFQRSTQLLGMLIPAARPRGGLIPLIQTNKYVVLKIWHS